MKTWTRRTALSAAAGISALAVAMPASAQDEARPSNAAAAASDVVYVYGRSLETTLPQELSQYGSDLVTIGRETFEEGIYFDAHQALQMEVPGLYISPAGPFSYSNISIQGSRTASYGPSDVLWLVDGVRINNRMYHSTLTDTLPANMIQRVEVLKGGESLFYGTNAVGGVINVVTREFSDTFGGDISMAADTNDSYSVGGMVRGAAPGGNFVLFGSYDTSDGYQLWQPAEPSSTDQDRSYDVRSIGGKYRIDLGPDLSATAGWTHTEAEIDDLRPTLTRERHNDRNEEVGSLRIDYTPEQGPQFFLKAYYHDWDTLYTSIHNDPTTPGATNVVNDDTYWGYEDYGLNAMGKFALGTGLEALAGYDFQRYSAVDNVWRVLPESEEVHAFFGQLRTTEEMFEDGMLAVGIRHNETEGNSATVWSVNGKYDLTETLYVQGNVGTNFVLPSAEHLYLNEPCCEVGNPNLEPEESINVNLSVGGVSDRFYWQATAFWREIDNIITYGDYGEPGFPNGRFVNGDKATISGFEFLGGVSLTDTLRAEASYTNSRNRIHGQGRQMDLVPREQAKASLTYDQTRYGGTLATRWVGHTHRRVGGVPGLVEFGDYIVADLSAFFYVDPDRRHQIAARLENVLDKEYGVAFRTAAFDSGAGTFLSKAVGAPRTLRLSYRYSF